jgi:hypothetical protein
LTEYNFSDEQHNEVNKEAEETKLERMQVEAKKARERDEGLRIFEGLSHRIQSGETRFDIPPPPPGEGNNSNNNGNGIRKKDKDGRNNPIKEEKEKKRPIIPTYKYSKIGKGDLYESVILGGIPAFLRYDEANEKIVPYQSIEEETRILRSPSLEEYPYSPYEFDNLEELDECLEDAKKQTIDSLYNRALNFIKLYNDQDEHKQILLAADVVLSYFQDKFGTTHYLGIVGDNNSGKSSIGNTFEVLAYRAVNMTSPTAPNIFRMLGMIEPGQCVLILDEADRIDESVDMMNILKSGNDFTKRVQKTNTNSWKQEYFYTYCLKVIIGEKSPSRFKAKGLLDRMLVFTVYPGNPVLDIKEVMNPQGDPNRTREYNRLIAFRKLMLIYRLIHFRDPILDIDINIQRRNKELCKPGIQLFYGTPVQEKIEQTFQTFLDIKNSKRARSLEAILIPVIIELVEQEGNQVSSSRIWEFIKDNIAGESYGSDEYHIADYTLYRTTVTKLLEDKFGAEPPRHTKKGSIVIFDLDKLRKIERSYDTDVNIKTTSKNVSDDEGDSGDGSDRSRQNAIPSNSTNKGGVRENLEDISGGAFLQDPSHPSHPSPSPPLPAFSCYHKNCEFHTEDEREYRRHGAINHSKNPLLYPTKFEIEKYGLTLQGKEWEI